MSSSFADRSRRWAGASARVLNWGPDTFWNATPSDVVNALGEAGPGDGAMDRAAFEALREAMGDKARN